MSKPDFSQTTARLLQHHIFLIGFMGSGKSTVAAALSRRLAVPALDSDTCIEQELGCSIADFFLREGEQAFRDRETAFLQDLQNQAPCLISCGGGMALRSENRALMRSLGSVIFLTATPETVFMRIGADTTRPLLKDKKTLADIADMMQARLPLYEDAASLKIATDHLSPSEITDKLICLLQPFLSGGESR